MSDFLVTDADSLAELCAKLATEPRIGLDTEFVPEYTFAPELCLVQVASASTLAAIDPLSVGSLAPLWSAMTRPDCKLIVHAGREELQFCRTQTGRLPENVFDVQLAAGLAGLGHPLSYANLVSKVLGKTCRTGETRTDWRKRPLTKQQIEYALDDVRYLLPLEAELNSLLDSKGRRSWFEEEMATLVGTVANREDGDRWRRLGGSGALNGRALAVLRELALWRDQRARQLDKPPKWILRDDLLIELAKRAPTTLAQLKHTRGLGQAADSRWVRDVLDAIERGLHVPDHDLPARLQRRESGDEQMVHKLLSAAMMDLARSAGVATSLLANSDDLRDLMEWHARGADPATAPRLARSWRREIVGRRLTDLLDGNLVVRIADSSSGPRLIFEPRQEPV